MRLERDHDKQHEGRIQRAVVVHWSQQRAWHGDEVTLSVRSELVSDGAAAELKIRAVGGGAAADLDTVSGKSIRGGQLDHKYKIAWKDKRYEDKREFICVAAIDTKLVSPSSPILRVDLEPPLLSA